MKLSMLEWFLGMILPGPHSNLSPLRPAVALREKLPEGRAMKRGEHFYAYTCVGRVIKTIHQALCVHRWVDHGVQENLRRPWVCPRCEKVIVREAGWLPFWRAIRLWRRGRGIPVRSSGYPWLFIYRDGSIEIDRSHPEGRRQIERYQHESPA